MTEKFKWPENAQLYSKVRVRLIEPAHVALVGNLTGKTEQVTLNNTVGVPFSNVREVEVIQEALAL